MIMLPGLGRGVNPHKMKRMMKQMGINIEELDDVEQIVIRTSKKKYVFGSDVSVSVMTARSSAQVRARSRFSAVAGWYQRLPRVVR